jgi:hypothetical protein
MANFNYLMIATATWYLTFCLTALPGPRGIFTIMRNWLGVMQCRYCLSLWVGLVFYSFVHVGYTDIVNVFGLVGAAHMLASWTGANYYDNSET